MERRAVRPPVVLGDERPFELRRDAEDAAERNVGDVEVAGAIERRPLEEAVDLVAGLVRIRPRGAALLAERIGQSRERARLDDLRRPKGEIPHGGYSTFRRAGRRRSPGARLRGT